MNFDDDLRDALQREPAPPGFAAKILANAADSLPSRDCKGAVTKARPLFRRPPILALAAAIALAALIPVTVSEYRRREEARALEARRQLLIALSITRTQLRQAQRKVNHPLRHTL